jgi:hypothetical protein
MAILRCFELNLVTSDQELSTTLNYYGMSNCIPLDMLFPDFDHEHIAYSWSGLAITNVSSNSTTLRSRVTSASSLDPATYR